MWLIGFGVSTGGSGAVIGVLVDAKADGVVLSFSSAISEGTGRDPGPGDGLAKGDLVFSRAGGALSNDSCGVVFGMTFSDDFALATGGLSSL